MKAMKDRYPVKRKYKGRAGYLRKNTEESRVRACLVEFGDRLGAEGEGPIRHMGKSHKLGSQHDTVQEEKGETMLSGEMMSVMGWDMVGGGDSFLTSTLPQQPSGGGSGLGGGLEGKEGKIDMAGLSGFEKDLLKASKQAMKEREELLAVEKEEEAELLQNMEEEVDEGGTANSKRVNKNSVGQMVGLHASEISTAVESYSSTVEETRQKVSKGLSGSVGRISILKKQKAALEREIEKKSQEMAELQGVGEELVEEYRERRQEQFESQEYMEKLEGQIGRMEEMEEKADRKGDLGKLRKLVMLNESLKNQESSFKEECKKQRDRLGEELAELREREEQAEDDPEIQRMEEIEAMHARVLDLHIYHLKEKENQNNHYQNC